jgi:hypothetical protein
MEQQPVKKRTSPWVWVGLGCGVLILGVIGFLVFIFTVVFGSMRNSTPYQEAVQRAQNDPRVIAALGTPIKPSYFFSGSINTRNGDGDAKFEIPLRGPKTQAWLHVVATKSAGKWTYDRMTVTPKGGTAIDLLTKPRGTDLPDA